MAMLLLRSVNDTMTPFGVDHPAYLTVDGQNPALPIIRNIP